MKLSPIKADQLLKKWCIENLSSSSFQITPPFPRIWPPQGDGYVIYYMYESIPMPTGIVRYEIRSPFAKATLYVPEEKVQPVFEETRGGEILGTSELQHPDPDLRTRLEQAKTLLFHLVTSRVSPTPKDRSVLRVYQEYTDLNPLIGKYLRERFPDFFKWLRK